MKGSRLPLGGIFLWNSMRVEGDCASGFVRAQSKSLRRERYNRPENVAAHAAEGSFNLKLARHQIIMLVVMIFGTFVTVLNQTLVTPALPSIMTEMNVDAATAQWLTTGFTPGQRHHDSHYRLSDRPLFHTQPIHGVDAHFTAGSAPRGLGSQFPRAARWPFAAGSRRGHF